MQQLLTSDYNEGSKKAINSTSYSTPARGTRNLKIRFYKARGRLAVRAHSKNETGKGIVLKHCNNYAFF